MQIKSIILVFMCFLPSLVTAVEPWGKTESEAAMCRVSMRDYDEGRVSNQKDRGHMHHYCDCLRFTNRALKHSRSSSQFRYNIDVAIDGCSYVVKHVSSSFYYLPKVYIARGRAYQYAKDNGNALRDFMAALKHKPDYARAYIELIKFYQKIGDDETAMEYAINGLKRKPDSKALKRRYLKLGGKEPFPWVDVVQ